MSEWVSEWMSEIGEVNRSHFRDASGVSQNSFVFSSVSYDVRLPIHLNTVSMVTHICRQWFYYVIIVIPSSVNMFDP